jgi:hypothetical protein
MSQILLTDRTGLLGTTAGLLAGLPPAAVYAYLLTRMMVPIILIVHATRGATPTQRISLIGAYLVGKEPPRPRRTPRRRPG